MIRDNPGRLSTSWLFTGAKYLVHHVKDHAISIGDRNLCFDDRVLRVVGAVVSRRNLLARLQDNAPQQRLLLHCKEGAVSSQQRVAPFKAYRCHRTCTPRSCAFFQAHSALPTLRPTLLLGSSSSLTRVSMPLTATAKSSSNLRAANSVTANPTSTLYLSSSTICSTSRSKTTSSLTPKDSRYMPEEPGANVPQALVARPSATALGTTRSLFRSTSTAGAYGPVRLEAEVGMLGLSS